MASASAKISSGHFDLWVLPDSEHSRWFARLDWYLNWQMSKGLAHNRPEPSTGLLELLRTIGLEYLPTANVDRAPLMVASQGRLPANKCVVLEYRPGTLRTWIEKIQDVCVKLKPMRLRVYLPKGTSVKEARAHWQDSDVEIEFSPDEEQTT